MADRNGADVMAILNKRPIRSLDDLQAFEVAMPLVERLPERSIHDVFTGLAGRQRDATAITMVMTGELGEEPRQVSGAGLLGLINQAANLFTALAGPRPGVAFMLPSLVETHATLWGAETAGYAVPINFLLRPEAIAALIAASGARVLVALGPHPALDIWQKALAVREQIPDLVLVRVAPPGTPAEPGVIDLHGGLAGQSADHLSFGAPGRDDDLCALFHTGGTTGVPKLVRHTHRGQLIAAFGGAVMLDYRPEDAMAGVLPLFHVAGAIAGGLSVFLAGVRLVIMSPGGMRNPAIVRNYWRIIEHYGISFGGGVPTSVAAALEVPLDGADLSRMRTGITGGAPMPAAIGERFRAVTGRALHQIYGMTEASGLIAIDPVGSEGGEGSVGWALPYTDIGVRHLTADGTPGEPCAPGETGVVMICGPHVSPGYIDPVHDAGVFIDGALNSGDLGWLDAAGRLHLAGRAKDLIIRSGHNIDPQMIEDAMMSHPAVVIAAAVGQPDAYAGEMPVCFVVLRPDMTADEADLLEHARTTIAERPAWPRRIHILPDIPTTAVGKIYKPRLRNEAAKRFVASLLEEQFAMAAEIEVAEGGKHGMRITIRLPTDHAANVDAVEAALGAYLFEVSVGIAPG